MSQRLLEQIRDALLNGEYDLTRHAIDEMAEDGLGIFDVESAILGGEIVKTQTTHVGRDTRLSGWREIRKRK
jgi:hypothetical protein